MRLLESKAKAKRRKKKAKRRKKKVKRRKKKAKRKQEETTKRKKLKKMDFYKIFSGIALSY